MPRTCTIALLFLLSACGGREEEASHAEAPAPTFDLVLEIDAPVDQPSYGLARQALRGLPLSSEGQALGELGRVGLSDFGARFQANLTPGEHAFTVRVPTPCGPRDLTIVNWELTQARLRGPFYGSISDRFQLGLDDLTMRHVYVVGGSPNAPVHVGEVEIPGGNGPHVVFSQGCEEAPVRIGSETIGTWRASGPTIVNLEPTACQRYEVRTLSAGGYARNGDLSRVIRGHSAETVPPNGDPSHAVDHFMEPLPETVQRRASEGALTLSGIVTVDCPTE